MGAAEKALFYKYLYATNIHTYYEFGSGGSTYKAIHAPNIEKIVSMESDTSYFLSTLSKLSAPKCERIFVDVESYNNWGNPGPHVPKSRYELYFKHIDSLPWTPDLVLIDGRWRVACALHTWARVAGKHTILLVDDFQRIEYAAILDYFEIVERAGNMVAMRPRQSSEVGVLTEILEKYEADHR